MDDLKLEDINKQIDNNIDLLNKQKEVVNEHLNKNVSRYHQTTKQYLNELQSSVNACNTVVDDLAKVVNQVTIQEVNKVSRFNLDLNKSTLLTYIIVKKLSLALLAIGFIVWLASTLDNKSVNDCVRLGNSSEFCQNIKGN